MSPKSLRNVFLGIVLPSFLAIALFIISFYFVLIPMFEKSMMDRKKEMILELTNTAWSILEENHTSFENGQLSLEAAKENALLQIEKMRYGNERKDYFWLIDHQPVMIMHPYRQELNNTDLSGYKDSHGNRLFVDAVRIVDSTGQGFIEYYWQWKDDQSRDVPKLSFVKAFKPWGWIIGTGIYLEDVRAEISGIRQRLFRISGLIVGVILLALAFIIRQGALIEQKRRRAEEDLKLSRLKYKSLVEAATEGTLMFVDGKVIFANQRFMDSYCPGDDSIIGLGFNELFNADIDVLISEMEEEDKSLSLETQVISCGKHSDVVISVSKVSYAHSPGFIVVVKDVSPRRQLELSSTKLSNEVEFSLQLMHQSIAPFIREALYCDMHTPIREAVSLMHKKDQRVIFIRDGGQTLGVVNTSDLRSRVLARELSLDESVSGIMTAPVLSISSGALMYEASLHFKSGEVSHLLVKDEGGREIGVLSYQECLELQHNSLSYIIQQIRRSESIKELKELYAQLPILISALVSSSDNIGHITRLITTVSDAITQRIIQMGIAQCGQPPCKFAFIAMGSEGRSEQTLKTDQDNAIIYEDGKEGAEKYFLGLAEYVNNSLNTVGYHNCKGLMMARNPKWCKPVHIWKAYFSAWIQDQDLEHILNSQIFFDLKFIFGEEELVSELRTHFLKLAKESSLFLYHLANAIIKYKPDFEDNIIDLKKVMLPITGYLRIQSLHKGIDETNSIKRLHQLREKGMVDAEACQEIEKAWEFLMHLRIKHQTRHLLNNEPPENEVHKDVLTSIELSIVKKILKQVQGLQSELGIVFKGGG